MRNLVLERPISPNRILLNINYLLLKAVNYMVLIKLGEKVG